MIQVTLYSRVGCHLCEDVLRDLKELQDLYPHRLEVIDIESDSEIRKKFDQEELRVVREILEEGMKDGTFQLSSSKIGAVAISAMMKGLELPLLLSSDHKTDRGELLEDLVRVLFYGIIKR